MAVSVNISFICLSKGRKLSGSKSFANCTLLPLCVNNNDQGLDLEGNYISFKEYLIIKLDEIDWADLFTVWFRFSQSGLIYSCNAAVNLKYCSTSLTRCTGLERYRFISTGQ